jgi:uncharacterized delta-60 repeat protein
MRARRQPRRTILRLEALEDRCLPSAGVLDPTFGSGGTVTTSFGGDKSFPADAEALVIQPDGKSVAGGFNESSSGGIFDLARYNADGSLDSTFGNKGEVQTKFTGSSASANALALQADGKILLAGNDNSTFEIDRYNADGSLDTTFGNKGMVSTPFAQGAAEVRSLALETVGGVTKIVAAGDVVTSSSSAFALARYNLSGSLDTSFGSSGLVVTNIGGRDANQMGLAGAVQGDAKIVLAGEKVQSSGQLEFSLARYNTDGSLDTTFGSGGLVFTSIGKNAAAWAVALQGDGKIVAAGWGTTSATDSYHHFALARYNSDGSLDTSFGSAGVEVTPPIGTNGDQINGLAIQPANGAIIAVGSAVFPNLQASALARYNPDGSLDATFGSGGIVAPTFGGGDTAVALQSDGKIVVSTLNSGKFGLARYLPSEPQIGSFTASPDPVTSGSSTTLTASNITDGNAGATITQVAFYLSVNGTNTLLGYGTQTSPSVWTFNYTVNLAPGTYTLLAQAEDSYGVFGDPTGLTLTVQ